MKVGRAPRFTCVFAPAVQRSERQAPPSPLLEQTTEYVPVAQLDRALDSDSKGQRFESSRVRHKNPRKQDVFGGFVMLAKAISLLQNCDINCNWCVAGGASCSAKRSGSRRKIQIHTTNPGHLYRSTHMLCCQILLVRCRFCSFLNLLSYRHTAKELPFRHYCHSSCASGSGEELCRCSGKLP